MGSCYGACLWDLSSIYPVFRDEDAQEVQPHCPCDSNVELGMWSSSLVILRDGTVRVTYYDRKVFRRLPFFEGTISTTTLITDKDASNPLKRYGCPGLCHLGIDRFARLNQRAVTVKLALPDHTPHLPSTISCIKLPTRTIANYAALDCFSGLIFITYQASRLSEIRTFIDFPIDY